MKTINQLKLLRDAENLEKNENDKKNNKLLDIFLNIDNSTIEEFNLPDKITI